MAEILSLQNLRNQVLAWMDETGDTDTTYNLVNDAINASHRERLTRERWGFMQWHKPETFTVTASQQYYGLHQEVLFPIYFWNRDQKQYLEEIGLGTLRDSGHNWNDDQDAALSFRFMGLSPVKTQPPLAGSTVQLTSSSGSDGASQGVIIRGDTADGVTTETITTGNFSSNSFTRILNVTKTGTWNGTLTLTAVTGGTTLVKLFPTELGRQHRELFLTKIPTATETVEYGFYRQPSPLSNDNDLPDIPAPYSQILVWDALLKISAYNAMEKNSVAIWMENRDKLEHGLRAYDAERHTLDAKTNYIRYIAR